MLKQNWSKYLLFSTILFIGIGFAYLSSQLNIIGTATLGASTWDVHFENINILEGSIYSTQPTIGSDGTSVDYVVDLELPGDYLKFTVDAVNNGSMDTMIKSINNIGLTEEQENYLEYSVTYANLAPVEAKDYLRIGSKETYIVTVTYKKDITASDLPSTNQSINLKFSVEFEKADSTGKDKKGIRIIKKEATTIATGDELAIGDEHFYIVSTAVDKTVLLSKYNLDVTNNIQSSGANATIVAFSNHAYWLDSITSELLSDYSDKNVYSTDFNASEGENYSIAYYVERYVNSLKANGVNDIIGRVLTRQDLTGLGCSIETCSEVADSNKFVYLTESWIGTIDYGENVLIIKDDGSISNYECDQVSYFGVRPVIVVPTSIIK